MPQNNEYAGQDALFNIMSQPNVKDFFQSQIKLVNFKDEINSFPIPFKKINLPNCLFDYVFVFDGSKTDYPIENSYPGAMVSLLSLNVSLLKWKEIHSTQNLKNNIKNHLLFSVLPNKNILPSNNSLHNGKDFFRESIFNLLQNTIVEYSNNDFSTISQPNNLFQSYLTLLHSGGTHEIQYPCEYCKKIYWDKHQQEKKLNLHDFNHSTNEYQKLCDCGKHIFITDFLRLHEGYFDNTDNSGIISQVMSCLEKIYWFNLITFINNNSSILPFNSDNTIFVLDGTLAIYGYASWISQAILNSLSANSYNSFNKFTTISIEKTGDFFNFFQNYEQYNVKKNQPILPNSFLYLANDIITKYIKPNSSGLYGQETYFGRKVFYKDSHSSLKVINIIYNNVNEKIWSYKNNTIDIENYTNSSYFLNILRFIDQDYTARYDNGSISLSLAHKAVSISNSDFSIRVFKRFIESNMKQLERGIL